VALTRLGLAANVAARQVRLARAIEGMPLVAEALAAGEIATSAAEMLVHARESDPEAFARCEEALVDAARSLPIAGLRRVLEHWRQAQDMADAERREDERFQRRRLHVSPTLDGMVRIDGDLDPETGEAVMAALRAVMDADARAGDRSDARTPSQWRADALDGSAGPGWTRATGRRSRENGRTSSSRSTSMRSRDEPAAQCSPTRAPSRRRPLGDSRATPTSAG
jgi:hypothetical protein